ncbi:MAG: hypothetical protein NW205_11430 [Hyphomicrobiaceae bacterium]|nr:hypothetical protein [Hyphomicrobiaceae bacterium]
MSSARVPRFMSALPKYARWLGAGPCLSAGCWRSVRLTLASLLLSAGATLAQAADPRAPAGLDPGGTAIAIITSGVDHREPEIASRLARDGEGEPIALDLIDGDVNAFAPADAGPGTRLAREMLAAYRHSRLIVVRADADNPAHVARAVMFLARTPARIAFVAAVSEAGALQPVLTAIDKDIPQLLVVVPAAAAGLGPGAAPGILTAAPAAAATGAGSGEGKGEAPIASSPAYRIDAWVAARGSSIVPSLATPGGAGAGPDAVGAAAIAAGHAACALHGSPASASNAAEIKRLALDLARPSPAHGNLPVLDGLCWYGGVRN